jgi:hypothetical protein
LFGNLQNILEQQYVLSKKCNISISETNMLADWEREVYLNLLMRDIEEERKALENKGK